MRPKITLQQRTQRQHPFCVRDEAERKYASPLCTTQISGARFSSLSFLFSHLHFGSKSARSSGRCLGARRGGAGRRGARCSVGRSGPTWSSVLGGGARQGGGRPALARGGPRRSLTGRVQTGARGGGSLAWSSTRRERADARWEARGGARQGGGRPTLRGELATELGGEGQGPLFLPSLLEFVSFASFDSSLCVPQMVK